jgi:hypothetical protein
VRHWVLAAVIWLCVVFLKSTLTNQTLNTLGNPLGKLLATLFSVGVLNVTEVT